MPFSREALLVINSSVSVAEMRKEEKARERGKRMGVLSRG